MKPSLIFPESCIPHATPYLRRRHPIPLFLPADPFFSQPRDSRRHAFSPIRPRITGQRDGEAMDKCSITVNPGTSPNWKDFENLRDDTTKATPSVSIRLTMRLSLAESDNLF